MIVDVISSVLNGTEFLPDFLESLRTQTHGDWRLWIRDDGSTDFAMQERFSGLILPLLKGSLPDFGPVFERYAKDLKHEAERTSA